MNSEIFYHSVKPTIKTPGLPLSDGINNDSQNSTTCSDLHPNVPVTPSEITGCIRAEKNGMPITVSSGMNIPSRKGILVSI